MAATEKTGQLEVRGDDEEHRGFLGVSAGRLVSAQFEDEDGSLALGAVFAIDRGDFEFLPQERVDRQDLAGELEELLELAGAERERILGIRELVPNDRVRFRLSDRAAETGEITLAPAQWRALLLIDGERDVAAIAERLQMRRLGAQQLLTQLVHAGLADAVVPPSTMAGEAPRTYRRLPPMQPIPPTNAGEQIALRGRLPDFPLETIVQVLAETRKTGRLELHAGRETATLGMSDGRLVSAISGEEDGELALGTAFTVQEAEFDFVPMAAAPAANLTGDLDALLDHAASVRDDIVAIRAVIPNDRARFVLSDRATRNPEIVLTPDQWRVVLGVNGERDVGAIAEQVRMRRLPVLMVLADLLRGGYVDVLPAAQQTWRVESRSVPWPPSLAPLAPAPVEPPVAAAAEAPIEVVPEPAPAEVETPLTETPLDREPVAEDRLAALEGVFGPPEPAPPPVAWEPPPAEPQPKEIDPRLAAFGAPTAEPEAPAPAWEPPTAEPEAPSWETSTWDTSGWQPPAPPAEPPPPWAAEADAVTRRIELPERGPDLDIAAASVVAPAPPAERKKGLFGGLFGGGTAAPAAEVLSAASRTALLATFANELVAAYRSGQYGKGRVEDRMAGFIMRADEQADPIDRPLPVTNDRLDVAAIEGEMLPEHQIVPYLAVLVRQIYDDAERVLGKDKARRGFRDVRDRLFGRDLALLHAPEVGARLPKV